MSQMSISGAVSGLDTAALINQLVSVESRQQQLIRTRMSNAQKAADVYSSLITSVKNLSAQATRLADTSSWTGTAVTSSSSTVTATATGNISSSLTFNVTELASAHTLASMSTVASGQSVIAGATITITPGGGTAETLDVGGGTLAEVVTAVNDADLGLIATAVQSAPGQYTLQVRSRTTGAGATFAMDGITGMDGMAVAQQGTDATIEVGTGPGKYAVTSSTNTFDSVVDGLSFTVSDKVNNVTLSAQIDGGTVADQVKSLVDTANSLLSDMSKQTAWNATTKTGGALIGESTIRQVQQSILSLATSSDVAGLSVDRYGKLTFDRSEFLTAFKADPAAVASGYGAVTSFAAAAGVNGTASLVRAPTSRTAGSYAVQVSVSAAKEQWRLHPPGGIISGQTVVIMRGSMVMSYTAGAGENLADAVNAINRRAAEMDLGVSIMLDGASVVLTAVEAGTSGSFTPTLDGLEGSIEVVGTDVEGSLNGTIASGTGTILSLNGTSNAADGIAVSTTVDAADITASGGEIGTFSYAPGFATQLTSMLDELTMSGTGLMTTAQAGRAADVKDLQTQIDAWDLRLEARRTTLTRQFTAMETMMAKLKTQQSFVSGLEVNMLGGN